MKKWLPLLLCFLPSLAFAQGAVLQQGGVFKGHAVQWLGNGYVADAGGPLANGLSPVDPVSGLLPIGYAWVNSGLGTCGFSGYAATTYSSLCWGFDGSGNGLLSLSSTGGSPTFSIVINGVVYPFPGPGGGDVVGPSPAATAGDLAIWNGGLTLKDGGLPPIAVNSEAALVAYPLTGLPAGAGITLTNYYAGWPAPRVTYTLQKSACSAANAGTQVASSTSGNCWIMTPMQSGSVNLLNFGASGSGLTTTGTTSASSPNIALGSARDFVNGEPIAVAGAGAAPTALSPANVTVVSNGATGSPTQYCYKVAAVDANGGVSTASTQICANDGGAQLGTVNNLNAAAEYENISWSASTNAIAYLIYGWTTGSEVFIGETADLQWNDFGFKAGGSGWNNHQLLANWISANPLSVAQPGFWHTTIVSGGGTSALVASGNAPSTVASGKLVHDDTTALTNAFASGSDIYLAAGSYPFFGYQSMLTTGQSLTGCGAECSVLFNYVQGGLIVGDGTASLGGVYLRDFGMDGSGGLFGDSIYFNKANQGRVANLEFDNYYTNMQFGNGSGTYYIQDVQSFSGLNGDYGIYIWGNDARTTQVIYFDGIRQFGGSSTTAKLMWIDGVVHTIHVTQAQWGESSQAGFRIANDIGASSGPNGIFFNNPGCNGQDTFCFNVLDVHHLEIANSFIQMAKGSSNPAIFIGPNAYQVWLNGVGRIYGTSTWGIQFQGHGLYMSDQSVFNNDTGSFWCDGGEDITINGGDSIGVQSDTPSTMTTATATAIKIGSTCKGPISISGNWLGFISNIEDDASPSIQVAYQGYPLGSPVGWPANIIDTVGDKSITVAAFPGVYAGTGGRIATLDIGQDSTAVGRTYTFDTAANIAAVVPIGSAFTIRVLNHTHSNVSIAGGTGTTPAGVTTIPSNGGNGMVSSIDLHGVVTAGPAVTLTGCSATAGVPCY